MADERGHLKVFIGMAPGVGKTFRMLQEGRAEADSGRDVVIGYLEPHGRAETVAQAEALETVSRRRLSYRGTPLEETCASWPTPRCAAGASQASPRRLKDPARWAANKHREIPRRP
jgi:Osmosensitive K+ channel His kinase sensor domain